MVRHCNVLVNLKKLNLLGAQVESDQPAGAVGNHLRKQIFFGYTSVSVLHRPKNVEETTLPRKRRHWGRIWCWRRWGRPSRRPRPKQLSCKPAIYSRACFHSHNNNHGKVHHNHNYYHDYFQTLWTFPSTWRCGGRSWVYSTLSSCWEARIRFSSTSWFSSWLVFSSSSSGWSPFRGRACRGQKLRHRRAIFQPFGERWWWNKVKKTCQNIILLTAGERHLCEDHS